MSTFAWPREHAKHRWLAVDCDVYVCVIRRPTCNTRSVHTSLPNGSHHWEQVAAGASQRAPGMTDEDLEEELIAPMLRVDHESLQHASALGTGMQRRIQLQAHFVQQQALANAYNETAFKAEALSTPAISELLARVVSLQQHVAHSLPALKARAVEPEVSVEASSNGTGLANQIDASSNRTEGAAPAELREELRAEAAAEEIHKAAATADGVSGSRAAACEGGGDGSAAPQTHVAQPEQASESSSQPQAQPAEAKLPAEGQTLPATPHSPTAQDPEVRNILQSLQQQMQELQELTRSQHQQMQQQEEELQQLRVTQLSLRPPSAPALDSAPSAAPPRVSAPSGGGVAALARARAATPPPPPPAGVAPPPPKPTGRVAQLAHQLSYKL